MTARCYWKTLLPAVLLICLAAVLPAAAQGENPVVFVNIANLNQRTGPGPEYAVQGTLPGGTMLPVLGRTRDSSWWQVQSDFGIGWLNGEHVLTRGNFQRVPVVTEFGVLGRPEARVPGWPVPIYALPNAASFVLGEAPSESQYPIFGQTYHASAETWYWLIQTLNGSAWVQQGQVAVVGDATLIPVLNYEIAMGLRTAPVTPNGIVYPPERGVIPSAPTAAQAAAPMVVPQPTSQLPSVPVIPAQPAAPVQPAAAEAAAAPVLTAPTAPDTLRIAGDCYALPLVSFLVQRSPVNATGLHCSDSNAGRDLVILGDADVGMVFGSMCGSAVEVPVATLYDAAGGAHALNFCLSAMPSARVQIFVNWLHTEQGMAAIRLYRGLPALLTAPVSAQPR